jgi:hypothetical protein
MAVEQMANHTDYTDAVAAWEHAFTTGSYSVTDTRNPIAIRSLYHYLSNVRKHLRKNPLTNHEVLAKINLCRLSVTATNVTITLRKPADSSDWQNKLINPITGKLFSLTSN